MTLDEAKEILKENCYLLEDKAANDYDTFEEYLKDFKEELLCQYMTPEIGEKKYKKIISNEKLLQEIKDNWSNGDYCQSEMVEYILDNKELFEDFTMGVGAPLGADQGIPHSMQGCAVPMMRLGDPAPYGRIQRLPSPPPRHRMRLPVIAYFGGTKYKLVKRKKRNKKRKKRG